MCQVNVDTSGGEEIVGELHLSEVATKQPKQGEGLRIFQFDKHVCVLSTEAFSIFAQEDLATAISSH